MNGKVFAFAVVAAGLAGCAADYPRHGASADAHGSMAAAGAAGKQCFRTTNMGNHTIADDRTMYVAVGLKDVYRMTMAGGCLSSAWPNDPLIIRTPGSTTLVCDGLDIDVSISRGGFQSPCLVDRITKLTPEEAAALPKHLRP